MQARERNAVCRGEKCRPLRSIFFNDLQLMYKVLVEFINTWQTLEHENVARLLGVTILGGVLCTVEKWTDNGSMITYLKDRPNANILELVRTLSDGSDFDGKLLKLVDRCKILHVDWSIFIFAV